MEEVYKVTSTEKLLHMEKELASWLAELKTEIEENGVLEGTPSRAYSSVRIPKDISYFRKERELKLKRGLQVAQAKSIAIKAQVMKREVDSCLSREYTPESLPLLLHQFFTDRSYQLSQCKYLHMLRWKRFCQHSSVIEQLYPDYKKHIGNIMKEYDDSVQRARRLAVARENLFTGKGTSSGAATVEDVVIYLQWLVCHFHSVKTIHSYLQVLQYLPLSEELITSISSSDGFEDTSDNIILSNNTSILKSLTLLCTPVSSQSGFTGLHNGSSSLVPPLHQLEVEQFKLQLQSLVFHFEIEYNMEDLINTANEMELFTLVARKFRTVFEKQEIMKTFPLYGASESRKKHWGMKKPSMALKKEANWIDFIKGLSSKAASQAPAVIDSKYCHVLCTVHHQEVLPPLRPLLGPHTLYILVQYSCQQQCYMLCNAGTPITAKQDPWQQKNITKLKQLKSVDELLQLQTRFFKVSNPQKVMEALRQHAATLFDPVPVQSLSVTSHPSGRQTNQIWKKIYNSPDLHQELQKKEDGLSVDVNEQSARNVKVNKQSGSQNKKNENGYSYMETLQLLGLDEGKEEINNDPVSMRGAYLSLLYLRHLRIRELQRSCLSILNYFRSVERTLTINSVGLRPDGIGLTRNKEDSRWINAAKGGSGVPGGLSSEQYLHYSPVDYKVHCAEFMEFSDIENHDDFYTSEGGDTHIQDQNGMYIIYDVALKDMKDLEEILIIVASQFIRRDKGDKESARPDLEAWAQVDIDRFAVILDLWSCELAFLKNKQQLVDCYFEAYQHVFDPEEQFTLAQIITDIMHKRPRFDFNSGYFVATYEAECECLQYQEQLIQEILSKQIDEQRQYLQKIWRDGQKCSVYEFGLPPNFVPKQPISVNNSCPALKSVFLLEFHPSLGLASLIFKALSQAYYELCQFHRPVSVSANIALEKRLLQVALEKLHNLESPGYSYSIQIQKDLFSDTLFEDPFFVRDIAFCVLDSAEGDGNKQGKEKQAFTMDTFCRLLELVTIRHRLIEASSETAHLAQLYKMFSAEMGFDEFHLYLRPVQFEFASHKEKADQPPPVFITALLEDDSSVDRYTPSSFLLGIHEIDENQIGKFSFRTQESIVQLLSPSGLENMQVVLACQVTQKNILFSAVHLAAVCFQSCPTQVENLKVQDKQSGSQNRSRDSSASGRHSRAAKDSESQASSSVVKHPARPTATSRRRPPEAFVSVQLEKIGPRDVMLNTFITKKQMMGTIMKNPEEVEKVKRELIIEFCQKFNWRMSQYSLRSQIIEYYHNLWALLDDIPSIRDTHFMQGLPNEKKGDRDSEQGLHSDPRLFQQRPRCLLSADGKMFLNLWFIPHFTDVLIMFKSLEETACHRALQQTLQIVAAFHDIVSYVVGFAHLGSYSAVYTSRKHERLTADWGGTEGIGAELQEIQKQIDALRDPTNPQEVSKLLQLRREVLFLQFDAAVQHLIREAFLSSGNIESYKAVTDNMSHALPDLSNSLISSIYSSQMNVPEPLFPSGSRAQQMYPWRTFLANHGEFP
ncbi:uncharacterized protein si:ch73-242m19.1, partial [Polypterus senegalus]|uniref:uncharacterized protein si:ch73-242m19.1 n=1 Tax=Polypterus senegalus TaxID=55291 RepID=UPI001962A1F9